MVPVPANRADELYEKGMRIIASARRSEDAALREKARRLSALVYRANRINRLEAELGLPRGEMHRGVFLGASRRLVSAVGAAGRISGKNARAALTGNFWACVARIEGNSAERLSGLMAAKRRGLKYLKSKSAARSIRKRKKA